MYAYDVNGDGLPDVITSLNPHGFGLAWYEQLPGKDAKGEIQFKQHLIINPYGEPNEYGVDFSQTHAVALADIDGDGLKDIVTGKRFWAHGKNGPDPQSNEPAVLYWFKLVRGPDHSRGIFAAFDRHQFRRRHPSGGRRRQRRRPAGHRRGQQEREHSFSCRGQKMSASPNGMRRSRS